MAKQSTGGKHHLEYMITEEMVNSLRTDCGKVYRCHVRQNIIVLGSHREHSLQGNKDVVNCWLKTSLRG